MIAVSAKVPIYGNYTVRHPGKIFEKLVGAIQNWSNFLFICFLKTNGVLPRNALLHESPIFSSETKFIVIQNQLPPVETC
jgi:hypothetical protein